MSENTSQHILAAARLLFPTGQLIELRVPKAGRQKTISGYFSDLTKLAETAAALETSKYPGVYWTLNPVQEALLARSDHKVKPFAENTTNDADILSRHWLLVDLDPKRPSGISSSEAEHAAALVLAEAVRSGLISEGWPEPLFADSGNGGHLVYPIELPNDLESAELCKRVLEALASRFDTDLVSVDRTTFNASRISKVYGTTARKGDNTTDRPHRLSRILGIPALLAPVSLELLRVQASAAPVSSKSGRGRSWSNKGRFPGANSFDLQRFLDHHGLRYRPPMPFQGGRKFVLEECPFDASHKAPDAAVFEGADGQLGFHCFHNSCVDRVWSDFRALFEPQRDRRSPYAPRPGIDPADPGPPEPDGAGDPPAAGAPGSSDARDVEIPLNAADVEAAVDAAIAANDLPAAMRLIPEIARVPAHSQALIQAKLRAKFRRDFPARDFSRAVRELAQKANEPPPEPPDDEELPPDTPDLTKFPLTDSGNGERIVVLYGKDIRYCVEFKKWLIWDGRRWKVDEAGAVTQKAKQMARLLYEQAKHENDSGLKRILQEHARDSESQARIVAALKRAESEPGMSVTAAELDLHRYLLNCLNGVVDVRTGELLQFERRYLITKLCNVKYVPDAHSLHFEKYIRWTMGESPDDGDERERVTRLVGFLQKAFGYALTGDVSEKAAFVFYGRKGNNGKTTLLTVFTSILSEYSTQLDINTLMSTKLTDNNMRADLAKLHGARLVITSEVDDGMRLSERLMKYLTAGMGKVTACRKFENPIEFDATHKIFMDCNYRPTVRGADNAIWNRLKCIPFEQHFEDDDPEIDKKLKDKILAESEGVLAWAVRGAMRWWKEQSLGAPPEVKAANTDWRDSDDPLKEFLEDCCEAGPAEEGYWVKASELSGIYDQWCKENRERYPLGRTQLTERLILKGFEYSRSRRDERNKQQRTWEGLKLRDDVTLVSSPRGNRMAEPQTF